MKYNTHVHLIITHGYIAYILKKQIRLHIYIEYMTVVSDMLKFTVMYMYMRMLSYLKTDV